jgi:hypothetical protein
LLLKKNGSGKITCFDLEKYDAQKEKVEAEAIIPSA